MTSGHALHVATLNVRNTADRWDARLPLLLTAMEGLQPELLGLQECVFPLQQDRLIGAAGPARYRVLRGWTLEAEIGNSLLVREPGPVTDPERLELGQGRSAIGALVTVADGVRVAAASTQLHHVRADAALRDEQAARLLDWLDAFPSPEAHIVMADLNDEPGGPAYRRMTAAGYRSAHLVATGAEPAVTWPSGAVEGRSGGRAHRQGYWLEEAGPGAEEPGCFDYIFVRGAVTVESCGLAFDHPAPDDIGLYPSDHLGLSARLVIGPT